MTRGGREGPTELGRGVITLMSAEGEEKGEEGIEQMAEGMRQR